MQSYLRARALAQEERLRDRFAPPPPVKHGIFESPLFLFLGVAAAAVIATLSSSRSKNVPRRCRRRVGKRGGTGAVGSELPPRLFLLPGGAGGRGKEEASLVTSPSARSCSSWYPRPALLSLFPPTSPRAYVLAVTIKLNRGYGDTARETFLSLWRPLADYCRFPNRLVVFFFLSLALDTDESPAPPQAISMRAPSLTALTTPIRSLLQPPPPHPRPSGPRSIPRAGTTSPTR